MDSDIHEGKATYMVAGEAVIVGLQGDDEGYYQGADGGKRTIIYIASILYDQVTIRWSMVELHRHV